MPCQDLHASSGPCGHSARPSHNGPSFSGRHGRTKRRRRIRYQRTPMRSLGRVMAGPGGHLFKGARHAQNGPEPGPAPRRDSPANPDRAVRAKRVEEDRSLGQRRNLEARIAQLKELQGAAAGVGAEPALHRALKPRVWAKNRPSPSRRCAARLRSRQPRCPLRGAPGGTMRSSGGCLCCARRRRCVWSRWLAASKGCWRQRILARRRCRRIYRVSCSEILDDVYGKPHFLSPSGPPTPCNGRFHHSASENF